MARILDTGGEETSEVDLPVQFDERVRPDIIKRAVLSSQSRRKQPHGSDPEAGLKHVTYWKKRNRAYRGIRGRSYPSSRTPRKIVFRRGMQMSGPGGEAPQAVGGRRAHPPKSEKDGGKDINSKERSKAIRSAIAATKDADLVEERGHRLGGVELPLVVESDIEEMENTSEVERFLLDLGLEEEMERVKKKNERSGRGKSRGRRFRRGSGPLIVVGEDKGIYRASRNLPGVDVVEVDNLNAELLAPGADPGRLVIWSENAINRMEDGLFG